MGGVGGGGDGSSIVLLLSALQPFVLMIISSANSLLNCVLELQLFWVSP